MRIAITGGTGFLGRYIVNHFLAKGHHCQCWYRATSDREGFIDDRSITWVSGGLHEPDTIAALIEGADAVVHAGLYRPPTSGGHRGADDLIDFAQVNLLGSLRLFSATNAAGIGRLVFISSCGVHDVILDDRPLDEAHPLWSHSHYGAHKAALEKFVHSYGLPHTPAPTAAPTHRHLKPKEGWGICALRPVGIYGLTRPVEASKWYPIVRDVVHGRPICDPSGGKEVHAEDVARAVDQLINADLEAIRGYSFNCYDLYVAAQDVAQIAKERCGSHSTIERLNHGPRHQIDTRRICALGMHFPGQKRLEQYVEELVEQIKQDSVF